MKLNEANENLMISYLLGVASAEEQASVEEQYFRDADFHALLLAVEQELICDYLRGQLPPDERTRFESYYLASSSRRHKYELTKRRLAQLIAQPGSKRSFH